MLGVAAAFGIFFFLLAIGTPVFVGIFMGAGIGLWVVRSYATLWSYYRFGLHDILAHYHFAIFPMFILIGSLAESGGLGQRAYTAFHKLLGHMRGGVLVATTYAAAAFGACSGSSVASAALFSKVALPELKKYHYSLEMSLGCIATAGGLALLIPPSGMMVIYAILTETSVGRLLIGGIIPGIILATMLALLIYVRVRINPSLAPQVLEPAPWRERITAMLGIWPVAIAFLLIIGSIYTGFVTPSEAAALGATVVLVWNFIARIRFKLILNAFRETAIISAQITILLVGGIMLAKVVSISGIPGVIIGWIGEANLPTPVVWLTLIVIWIILGMVIDSTSQLVLTLPFAFPIMTGLGVDPITLGIAAILTIEMGVITPPVGFNCYVVASIAGVDPEVAFRGIMPFFLVLLLAVVIFISFPILSTWLPTLAFG